MLFWSMTERKTMTTCLFQGKGVASISMSYRPCLPSVPGSELGRGAREALKRSQQRLEQTKVNLGQAYSFFILGMGNSKCHHTQQGR